MRIFRNIIILITVAFLVWFMLSYFEVNMENIKPTPTELSNWNLFHLFI